jgi:hypothetical protein
MTGMEDFDGIDSVNLIVWDYDPDSSSYFVVADRRNMSFANAKNEARRYVEKKDMPGAAVYGPGKKRVFGVGIIPE